MEVVGQKKQLIFTLCIICMNESYIPKKKYYLDWRLIRKMKLAISILWLVNVEMWSIVDKFELFQDCPFCHVLVRFSLKGEFIYYLIKLHIYDNMTNNFRNFLFVTVWIRMFFDFRMTEKFWIISLLLRLRYTNCKLLK